MIPPYIFLSNFREDENPDCNLAVHNFQQYLIVFFSGYDSRPMFEPPRVREKLLPLPLRGSYIFRNLRFDGAIRVGERSGGCAHEASGGKSQAGENLFPNNFRGIVLICV